MGNVLPNDLEKQLRAFRVQHEKMHDYTAFALDWSQIDQLLRNVDLSLLVKPTVASVTRHFSDQLDALLIDPRYDWMKVTRLAVSDASDGFGVLLEINIAYMQHTVIPFDSLTSAYSPIMILAEYASSLLYAIEKIRAGNLERRQTFFKKG